MFANQVREEQKDANLNFTQLARLVGDRWKVLSQIDKEAIESDAAELKRQYTTAVEEYKKSRQSRLYQDYLLEFKERALRDEKPEKLEPPKKAVRYEQTHASTTGSSQSPSGNESRSLPDARSLLSISSIIGNAAIPAIGPSVSASPSSSVAPFPMYSLPLGYQASDSFSRRLPFPVPHQAFGEHASPSSMQQSHEARTGYRRRESFEPEYAERPAYPEPSGP